MSREIYPKYPPDLNEEQLQYLITNVKDWSIANGLAVRPVTSWISKEQDPVGSLAVTAPVTLFPSLFPRNCFEQGLGIQTAYNELYAAIASNETWLKQIVEELVEVDDFIAELWKVHQAVKKEGYAQDTTLGLFRSDYMVHLDPTQSAAKPTIKQVEFNTIASSFGGLSTQVSKLHNHLLSVDAYPEETSSTIKTSSLPPSTSVPSLAGGLAAGHQAYGKSRSGSPVCVIFLVQDPERNVFDQRHLEYTLFSEHQVRAFRVPFNKIMSYTKLDGKRTLLYTPPHAPDKTWEVSLVYFRAGYSPDDYSGKADWDARLHIERSAAVKCPSILTHLAGSKKVQQVLATPNSPHLARFLPDKSRATEVFKTFAPIYPLDKSEAGQEACKLAQNSETATRYVLKPQREGGGNNVYRKAIPKFLEETPESHWPAYILMEMIEPPALTNTIFRNGEVQKGGVIGELGVYGVCLWKTKSGEDGVQEMLENKQAGYLLRTKGDQSEEGGVAAGFGSVDSVCLVDV
ncbi:glutathione synthetase large chain [Aureobasidium pullulans]|nr:glutathione synthetase large chain [Aureobasidium pullulans]